MALVTAKAVFLHTPKTGGTWIRTAIKECGIDHYEIGDTHSHFPELLQYKSLEFFKKRKIFTFIRHPLTWYQSRWAFRIKTGWQLQHPLDYSCASNDFRQFVRNALKFRPTGWVVSEFERYLNADQLKIEVGRIEELVPDFISIMKMSGYKVPKSVLSKIPIINDGGLDGRPSGYWARYTPELASEVNMVESKIITQYYHNYDCNIGFGDQPY